MQGKSLQIQLIYIIVMACFHQYNCVFIKMHAKIPHCVYKEVQPNEHLTINYMITGDGESKVKMEIFESKKNIQQRSPLISLRNPNPLFTIEGEKEYEYKLTPVILELYEICFRNQDNQNKVLLFDLLIEKHKDKTAQDEMDEALGLMSKSMKHVNKIQKNQYSQFLRNMLHAKKINTTEIKIKWCAFIKIQILVILSLAQIYILTSFFTKKNNAVNPGI